MLVLMVLKKSILKIFLLPLFLMAGLAGCDDDLPEEEDFSNWETITVTASAYNSLKAQTEGNPEITAWGDTLAPGMKSIAVLLYTSDAANDMPVGVLCCRVGT